jgi:hypothetical protein
VNDKWKSSLCSKSNVWEQKNKKYSQQAYGITVTPSNEIARSVAPSNEIIPEAFGSEYRGQLSAPSPLGRWGAPAAAKPERSKEWKKTKGSVHS